jgi:hypothetical protein
MTCLKASLNGHRLALALIPLAVLVAPAPACIAALALPAAAPAPASASSTGGTNVVGTDDAAMGLIVLPWKPLPDDRYDRSPNIYGAGGDKLDADVLRARIEIDTERSELRRQQIESGR